MNPMIIKNACIVTPTEAFIGSMRVEDGIIQSIDRGNTGAPGAPDPWRRRASLSLWPPLAPTRFPRIPAACAPAAASPTERAP